MSFKAFYEKYFLLNLEDYPNFGISLEINKVMFFLVIGIIVAAFVINYNRNCAQQLVSKLMRHSAFDSDNAKTLGEMRITSFWTKHLLSSSARIKGIIKRSGEKIYTYDEYIAATKEKGYKEEKIDFETARFYIPEDKRDEATHIHEMKDTTLIGTILFALLMLALCVCLMFLMPEILPFLNNLLEN